MDRYGFLASCYDQMTLDVPYGKWADFIEKIFCRYGIPGKIVLDLACGTGSLTRELALRGYDMIGLDLSAEMLNVAMDKCGDLSENPPIFLQQPMEEMDLYGTMDACVCCLDSMNYVRSRALLQKTFSRIHLFLAPGGVLLFDIKPPAVLQQADGDICLDETEDFYCVWRGEFSPRRKVLTYGMDLFHRREDGLWERGEEVHEEFAHEPVEILEDLQAVGFVNLHQYGDLKLRAPTENDGRIFFVAQKKD